MSRFSPAVVALAFLLVGLGCSSSSTYRAPEFNPVANRRVAVLPFVPTYDGRNLPTSVVDDIPLVGERVRTGEDYLRRAFIARLSRGAFDIVETGYVDTRLTHAGLFADQAFRDASVQELGQLLSVDAVIFGEVTEWDVTYLGLETRHSVEANVQMIDVDRGEVLVSATVGEEDGGGLSGGPTGFTDLAVQPILALSSANLIKLGRKVANGLASPFLPSEMDIDDAEMRAPFLLFATHDQPAGRALEPGQVLTVAAQGAAGMRAEWVFGTEGVRGSMSEVEAGVYVGKIAIPRGLVLREEILSVELANARGYRSRQTVAHKPLNTTTTSSTSQE